MDIMKAETYWCMRCGPCGILMPRFIIQETLPCRKCGGVLWRVADEVLFECMVVDAGVEV